MPRKKNNINNVDNNLKSFNLLIKDINESDKYFILNYDWFTDYCKIIDNISNESMLRYSPKENNKNFIELLSESENIYCNIKIPIIKTNINYFFITPFKHNISFSKYHNNFILFIFNDKYMTIKYNYIYHSNPIEINNDTYFSLYGKENFNNFNDINEDETNIIISNDEENVNSNIFIEMSKKENDLNNIKNNQNNILDINNINKNLELISCSEEIIKFNQKNTTTYINDIIIKNVIYYLKIEFDNFKDILKKLYNCKIDIIINQNKLLLIGHLPNKDKNIKIELSVLNINPEYLNKNIKFSIHYNSISKIKTFNNKFNIISSDDKNIFKNIEIKIIIDQNEKYGLTIFPSNFTKFNRLLDNQFDIYNSILIYIPAQTDF